jgi:hypothetical protein
MKWTDQFRNVVLKDIMKLLLEPWTQQEGKLMQHMAIYLQIRMRPHYFYLYSRLYFIQSTKGKETSQWCDDQKGNWSVISPKPVDIRVCNNQTMSEKLTVKGSLAHVPPACAGRVRPLWVFCEQPSPAFLQVAVSTEINSSCAEMKIC